MANTVPPKYTTQIGPTVLPEVAGEMAAWAEVRGVSAGAVARELIDYALPLLRERWAQEHGKIPYSVLLRHVSHQQERGDRQIANKRSRDRTARTAGGQSAR